MNRRETSKGMILYEEVLQKNFQIIESFLNKFPLIFKKHDGFEESLKKLNDRLALQESETMRIRQDLQLRSTLLQKKISTLKQNNSRSSRSSSRVVVPDVISSGEERRSSIFRISSTFKQGARESNSFQFSKERSELLGQLQRKHQQSEQKMQFLNNELSAAKERINYLTTLISKSGEQMDQIKSSKVDQNQFGKLQNQYNRRFEELISRSTNEKYQMGSKLIEEKVGLIHREITNYITISISGVKKDLLQEIQKTTSLVRFHDEMDDIKNVIEKMVDQSIQVFANKEQTKKYFILLEKKIQRMGLLMDDITREEDENEQKITGVQCVLSAKSPNSKTEGKEQRRVKHRRKIVVQK